MCVCVCVCVLICSFVMVFSHYGDTEFCRKILLRGVNSASDDPEQVIETLLQFEREEGDLASYETSLEKCAAQLRRLGERREKVRTEGEREGEGGREGESEGVITPCEMKTPL